jgi:phosphate transport system substrate-binding protein
VRLVRVAVRAGEPAFSPTPENLSSGDYPLALPLQIVFRREATARLRPLLKFLGARNSQLH